MSPSSSSSSCDHNQYHLKQVSIGDDISSKSSLCGSIDSHRSDEQIYNPSALSSFPLLYFNNFAHFLQPSSSSPLSFSLAFNERSCSVSPSTSSSLPNHCSSSCSTPHNDNNDDDLKGYETMRMNQN